MTLQDQIWDTALSLANRGQSFTLGELEFNNSEKHAARRVLRTIEKYGWLVSDGNSVRWYPGEKVYTGDYGPVQTTAPQTAVQCSKCGVDILPDDSYVDIRRTERSANNSPPRVRYTIWCVDCDGSTLL
ncbi:hypothetical protein JCM30237_05920 [Halolamina litorea]